MLGKDLKGICFRGYDLLWEDTGTQALIKWRMKLKGAR